MKTHPDIALSTGRVIVHTRVPAGYQQATPSTGYYALTPAECEEYDMKLAQALAANTKEVAA
jgi:hypothetical protein